MIKYQVQSREIVTKDKEIAALRAQLAQSQQTVEQQEHTILEQQNKLDHLEGCIQRLEVRLCVILTVTYFWEINGHFLKILSL